MTWGRGAFGQLGNGSNRNEAVPTFVEVLSKTKVKMVACGWQHTMALTQKGEVFSWVGGGSLIKRDTGRTDSWDTDRIGTSTLPPSLPTSEPPPSQP